ncbi:MAG: hypothetical protein AB7I37_24965 [Pirellulales bacterium]
MVHLTSAAPLWLLATVLPLGLASAAAARISEGSMIQTWCQRLFLAFLGIVGVTTFVSLSWGQGSCMLSGFTLSTMAVMATVDFGFSQRTAP